LDDTDRQLLRVFARDRLGIEVDEKAFDRIAVVTDLLAVWNRRIRLTSARDDVWLVRKHVVDSLACLVVMPPAGAVLDLGSGAGFPGLIVACVRPDLVVTLIDSRQKAVSFLREAIRAAALPAATALCVRAEVAAAAEPRMARSQQVVMSRAIRMDAFLGLAMPLRAGGGLVVSMQTPNIDADTATRAGALHGLELTRVFDYELPSGESRRLLVWR
jgi:16S rRNA (guanine527-N7)-methyltransferase